MSEPFAYGILLIHSIFCIAIGVLAALIIT